MLVHLGREAPGGPVVVSAPGRDRRRWVVTTVADDLFNAFVEPGAEDGYEWERYPGC